jgi:glycosyltransferase involved in cell wall biosynthesis
MRIWLVQTGEEMPFDGQNTRLLRTALLAIELAQRGHEVVYWNSTFNHQLKFQRFKKTTTVIQDNLYSCIFLKGRPYSKNISVNRILSQQENARAFKKIAPDMPRPDVILCGFPTIELAHVVSIFARDKKIPLVMDARDMWPEVIETHLTPILKIVAFPILTYWKSKRNKAFSLANSIVGISGSFVAWGAACAKRKLRNTDCTFHLAANAQAPSAVVMSAARDYWEKILGPVQTSKPLFFMAGNLSARVDIMTVIEAAMQTDKTNDLEYTLVVCGKGDLEDKISQLSESCHTLVYAGWRSAAEIKALSERAVAGILAYSNTPDLMAGLPNKIGEYLSFGLPIITCLKGETQRLLGHENIIISYIEGDVKSAREAFLSAARAHGKMNKKARECYFKHFDPTKIYSDFADHLEKFSYAKANTNKV